MSSVIEPQLSFEHARLKVEWATIHIQHVEDMCRAFLDTKPHVATLEDDPKTGGHALKIGFAKPIPPEFSLMAGDICGNLRAALDFCWMGLVRAHCGPDAAKSTLPIADNRKGIETTVDQAPIGPAREKAKRLLLDSIKCYRNKAEGGNQAIIVLNELSNRNKHNWLLLQVGHTELPVMRDQYGNTFHIDVTGGVGNTVAFGPGFNPKFEYEGEPTAEIVFGDGMSVRDKPLVPTLINLSQAARDAVYCFTEEFRS